MKWIQCILWLLSLFLMVMVSGLKSQNIGGQDQLKIIDLFSDFGMVSQEAPEHENDHSYPFEYLSKRAAIRFVEDNGGIRAVIDYLVRIKVFTGDPLELADASLISIPFYEEDRMERVQNLEAITHQPDGSRVMLAEEAISTSQINSRYSVIEFKMPDVEQGSILEYKYTVNRRYIEELPDFYFSHRVPTKLAEITLQNERFLRYDAITEDTDFEVAYTRQRIDTSSVPQVFSYERPDPILLERWIAENVPAVDPSAYVSSVDDLRGKVRFLISEFGIPRQPLDNSWELVAAQIRKNADPEALLDRQHELFNEGTAISRQFDSKTTVQDSIFYLVNSRALFNGMNAVFADDTLQHVMSGRPANQAEINMSLLAMLRGAGIESYPLYISGRDFGRINRSFPSLYQFNRMLVHSRIDERNWVMDASFPHSEPDLIPIESYNEQGFVLREDSFEWIDIRPEKSRFDLDISIDASLNSEGDLSGRLSSTVKGYPAQRILEQLGNGRSTREVAGSTFLEIYGSESIINAEIDNRRSAVGREVEVRIDFEIEQYATSFTDGLEYRPMLVGYLFQNPFESASRKAPITLDAPETLDVNYTISIPDGFVAEQNSGERDVRLSGAELVEMYNIKADRLVYGFNIDISRKEFSPGLYPQLRRIYERWVEISNGTWMIKKDD